MKLYHSTLCTILSSLFIHSGKGLTDSRKNQLNNGAEIGIADLSAGGMLAITVLGIFGAVLLVIICCASWSMIMTCFQLRDSKTKSEETLQEPQRQVVYQGTTFFTSNLFQHPLENEWKMNSTESVV